MNREAKKISGSIKNMLDKNHLLTLSTSINNEPYSNTAFYVYDKNMDIYIWSEEGSVHSENLKKNKKVAINIFNSKQKWGSLLQGLQAIGTADKVNGKDLIKAGILYIRRFPNSLKLVKNPKGFHERIFESKLYKIQLDKIKVFDEKAFGKENSKKISLRK